MADRRATRSHAADRIAVAGAQTERAERQQVVGAARRRLDQAPAVLALGAQPPVRYGSGEASLLGTVVIAVANDAEPARDQTVVNRALAFELVLLAIAFRQPAFHLAKAPVMQLRRVGVNAGHRAARRRGKARRLRDRPVGVIGCIERHQDARKRHRRIAPSRFPGRR